MRRLAGIVSLILLLAIAPAILTGRATRGQSKYAPITKYDPQRNADQDIRDAVVEAKRTNRRVLLEVGGEWCSWCHRLDEFFESHPDLITLRDQSFVTLKINYSEENPNKEVLSRYAPIPGYPHLFVLDAEGKMVRSQDTSVFEEGKTYVHERLATFLTYWATHTEAGN